MSNNPPSGQTDPLTIQQLVLKPLHTNPEIYAIPNQLPTDDLKRKYALESLEQQSIETRAKIRVLSAYAYSQLPRATGDASPSPPASRSPSPPSTRTTPAESPHSRPISPWLPMTSPHTPHLHQQHHREQKRQLTFQQMLQATFKPTPERPKPVVKKAATSGPTPYQQQQHQQQWQPRRSSTNNSTTPFPFNTAPTASPASENFATAARRGFGGGGGSGTRGSHVESEAVRLARKTVRELDDFDRAVEKARTDLSVGISGNGGDGGNGNGGGGGGGNWNSTAAAVPPLPATAGAAPKGQGGERTVDASSREGNQFRPDLDPRRR